MTTNAIEGLVAAERKPHRSGRALYAAFETESGEGLTLTASLK